MKRKLTIIFFLMIMITTGCKDNAGASSRAEIQPSQTEDAQTEDEIEEKTETKEIDIDLTSLSSTMVYSEVYNMMISPEDYIGKIVKMNGTYEAYHDDATGKDYFSCIISDATACCSQGIEFIPSDDYRYPEDYPEDAADICVVGEFDTYKEGEYTYCTLRNASMVF